MYTNPYTHARIPVAPYAKQLALNPSITPASSFCVVAS
jgi:hypothetical protein